MEIGQISISELAIGAVEVEGHALLMKSGQGEMTSLELSMKAVLLAGFEVNGGAS